MGKIKEKSDYEELRKARISENQVFFLIYIQSVTYLQQFHSFLVCDLKLPTTGSIGFSWSYQNSIGVTELEFLFSIQI